MLDLLVAWVAFPAIQLLLWFGCGSLVVRMVPCAGGGRAAPSRRPSNLDSRAGAGGPWSFLSLLEGASPTTPWALVAPIGFCVVVVVGGFSTAVPALAEFTTPVVVLLALGGLALGKPWRAGWPSAWLIGALAVVFAVYAAPIVLSGSATFAGYIKLDDTATWLALTDRVMEAGRSLDGLPPSSYEATLAFNLADGYPIGAFIPLGVGQTLVGLDAAWLVQPYMALLAVLLALALWDLSGRLMSSGRARALVIVLAAQPALLYGYYLWGGIKELAAAALIALVACLAFRVARPDGFPLLVPLALAVAALVGCLSLAGAVWVGPLLLGALVAALGESSVRRTAIRAATLLALVALMIAPVLLGGSLLPPTSSPLDDPDARGNLIEALSPLQALGVWPAGDFRVDPDAKSITIAICAFVVAAAIGCAVIALHKRRWDLTAYLVGVPLAAVAIALVGSPWVQGKAFAIVSPVLLFAALLGCAWAWSERRLIVGAGVAVLLGAGVVWSNALAYSEVNLAPREQLIELEEIGEMLAGEGPVLMTEYQPYGVRHFLRDAEPEGASELRRRLVPLADGSSLAKGLWADTDDFLANAFEPYEALVLRRSPEQSRPPGQFSLAWSGAFYEVWTRAPETPVAVARLALGDGKAPTGEPSCSEVRDLARRVKGGTLVAAESEAPVFLQGLAKEVELDGGSQSIWLEGSFSGEARVLIDGERVSSAPHALNNEGLYAELAVEDLTAGTHEVRVEVSEGDLAPGTGASSDYGSVAIGPGPNARSQLVKVKASAGRELCNLAWDWIEALPSRE